MAKEKKQLIRPPVFSLKSSHEKGLFSVNSGVFTNFILIVIFAIQVF